MSYAVTMCLSKEVFSTAAEAQKVVDWSRAYKDAPKLKIYKCPLCTKYHISSACRRR